MRSLSKEWKIFLFIAFIAGILLRVVYVNDMEYKEDEEYNFQQTQIVRGVTDWPVMGMPSGVYLQNPGMSVWVFIALAKISNATTPTALAHALQIFAVLGIFLIIPFATRFLKKNEQEPWLWACALALVNPFAILYQRKLWPEPFLPFFSMLMLMGWWKRHDVWGALVWGFIGAWLGQIHMSGFFLAGGFFVWTLLHEAVYKPAPLTRTHWKAWFIGSAVGAIPLIPWFLAVLKRPMGGAMTSGIGEAIQLKYWVFWITDSLGLHLGNPLGLMRGSSLWHQISDFVRYPIINGHPSYLTGVAHFAILALALWIFGTALVGFFIRNGFFNRQALREIFFPKGPMAWVAISAALWGCGLLLTGTTVNIRRYYMMVTFPLEFVWLAYLVLRERPVANARAILGVLWCAQLFISANFVGYIHVNEGSLQGDYGPAYHVLMKQRAGSK
ncbi:MAG TPA: hypothetical protein DCS07_00435 [Bdellovibrionales bacterium]|nr:MAG: hypothetical protein A2Z97_12780 [Bdellovibrionales bacterium GWB1_52_6]OFZ02842.1 MAG: hypothetical protein A2X97_04520 [Bdellovibrionales bacterium GWA1_52_35]OFZ33486.1 MAG: hypothetical protein A2070_14745 [Bdellovibrionales bacterium GWC1_52_8]HAR41097.1 hypothetical protein [Bdellovibrionales bacterium]HCM38424.1 hypothetical protein [Bdellovibrionales bacterium]